MPLRPKQSEGGRRRLRGRSLLPMWGSVNLNLIAGHSDRLLCNSIRSLADVSRWLIDSLLRFLMRLLIDVLCLRLSRLRGQGQADRHGVISSRSPSGLTMKRKLLRCDRC